MRLIPFAVAVCRIVCTAAAFLLLLFLILLLLMYHPITTIKSSSIKSVLCHAFLLFLFVLLLVCVAVLVPAALMYHPHRKNQIKSNQTKSVRIEFYPNPCSCSSCSRRCMIAFPFSSNEYFFSFLLFVESIVSPIIDISIITMIL